MVPWEERSHNWVADPIDFTGHWSDYERSPVVTQVDCSMGSAVLVAVDISKARN